MTTILWTGEASKSFKEIFPRLSLHQQDLILRWLREVETWPPERWFDLRDRGADIAFQLDNRFVLILGIYLPSVDTASITHFRLRKGSRHE